MAEKRSKSWLLERIWRKMINGSESMPDKAGDESENYYLDKIGDTLEAYGGMSGFAPPDSLLSWWSRANAEVSGDPYVKTLGGEDNEITGDYALALAGKGASLPIYGAVGAGGGRFNSLLGETQWIRVILSGYTESNETIWLTLNGEDGGPELQIPTQTMWLLEGKFGFMSTNAAHLGYYEHTGFVRYYSTTLLGSTSTNFKSGQGSPLPGVSLSLNTATAPYVRYSATGSSFLNHHWVGMLDIIYVGRGL